MRCGVALGVTNVDINYSLHSTPPSLLALSLDRPTPHLCLCTPTHLQLTTPGQFEELCEELDSIATTLRAAAALAPSPRRIEMDRATGFFSAAVEACSVQRAEVIEAAGVRANTERAAALAGLAQVRGFLLLLNVP